MKMHICKRCGYLYDPDEYAGVPFECLAAGWECPTCGMKCDKFTGYVAPDDEKERKEESP